MKLILPTFLSILLTALVLACHASAQVEKPAPARGAAADTNHSTCVPFVCQEQNPSRCTMDIYALEGHKIHVTEASAKNGYAYQQQLVAQYLVIGKVYTVERTFVSSSSTSVLLKEFPKTSFNSVNLVDVCVQSANDRKKHPDWDRYPGAHI